MPESNEISPEEVTTKLRNTREAARAISQQQGLTTADVKVGN